MAQYDLYRRQGASGYLLDVQSRTVDMLQTRVVVPLMPPTEVPRPMRDLHPVFDIAAERFVMATQLIGAIPRRALDQPVGSLAAERDAITRALDLLLTGF